MKKKRRSSWILRSTRRLLPIVMLCIVSMCFGMTIVVFKASKSGNRSFRFINNEEVMPSTSGINRRRHFEFVDNGPVKESHQFPAHEPDDLLSICEQQKLLIQRHSRPKDEAYNFNVTASDNLPCDRSIPDTRPPKCSRKPPTKDLNLTVSVIIPFFNEALSVLLRTVHSIITRTPPRLLKEIILVDDASTYDYLKTEAFDRYWRLVPKVRVLRSIKREGLIRARMFGADMASGDVLVFMDAHVECNEGWLEPLLAEIVSNPHTVAQPFVDGLDIVTLEYAGPEMITKSAFTWDLRYVWMELPPHIQQHIRTEGDPYHAPTLVGCAFAVQRAYFYALGGLDTGLRVWGGENLELAFRAWTCGGAVTTVPCSRVGHLFKLIPYPDDISIDNVWLKNLVRIAEVWMDDYKRYFYSAIKVHDPQFITGLEAVDQSSLDQWRNLRRTKKCRTFQWYLDNVIPELPLPPLDSAFHGEIVNKKTNACWEVMEDGHVTINYRCYPHKIIPLNYFTLTRTGLLLYRDKCVKFLFPTPSIAVDVCPSDPREFGIWNFDLHGDERRWGQLHVTLLIDKKPVTWCMEHLTSAVEPHKDQQMPQSAPVCDINNEFQFWAFTYRFKYD